MRFWSFSIQFWVFAMLYALSPGLAVVWIGVVLVKRRG